jgi:VWFA-related protein
MTRGVWIRAAAVAATVSATAAQAPQPPVFRSAADLVSVDVTVRGGSQIIGGLSADDFVLRDNGVLQRIEALEARAVPIDLTLVIDVSGPTNSVIVEPRPAASVVGDVKEKVERATGILREGDRVRVLTVDAYVDEALPRQAAGIPVVFRPFSFDGRASLHDALVAALLQPVEPDRRHFVVAYTKGEDILSAADAAALPEIARRSDARLHIIQTSAPLLAEDSVADCLCTLMGICSAPAQFWTPVARRGPREGGGPCRDSGERHFERMKELLRSWRDGRPEPPMAPPIVPPNMPDRRVRAGLHPELLAEAARASGGEYHAPGTLADQDLVDTLTRVVDDFRHSYVLRYAPQGVKREGWHEIAVTVPRHPTYTTSARRGYAIEAPSPARSAPAPAASPADALTRAFERNDVAAIPTAFRDSRDRAALLRGIREAGSPWPNAPRRTAVFMLDVLTSALALRDPSLNRNDLRQDLLRYATLVRHPIGPDAFECAWHATALARLEGMIEPDLALPLAARAIERCPAHPRVALAHAVLVDQQWALGTTTPQPGQTSVFRPSAEHIAEVTSRYAAAAKFPETAAEARLRSAWFYFRIGQLNEAAALVASIDTPDRQMAYLGHLVRGHVARAQNQPDAAAAAFRAALAQWPGGQAARVALMTLLLARGARDEAEQLADAIQGAPDAAFDPWWMYWQGDYRAYPTIFARLKEMAR